MFFVLCHTKRRKICNMLYSYSSIEHFSKLLTLLFRYRFDCHGFVRYMINDEFNGPNWRNGKGGYPINNYESWRRPMKFIGLDGEGNPIAKPWNVSGLNEEWWAFGEKMKGKSADGWKGVTTEDLRRGDIIMTKKHLMIAMGSPDPNGMLRIADSTATPHFNDSHRVKGDKSKSGLGTGEIKVEGNMMNWSNGHVNTEFRAIRLV